MDDDLMVSVHASSAAAGVTPVAFLAVVELIDADGAKRYEVVASTGITEARRATLAAMLSDS